MSMQNRTIYVPTAKAKPVVQINLSDVRASNLKLLEEKDPFMYYSIPSVYKAKLSLKRIDLSKIEPSEASPSMVSRKSRLSTECHPAVWDEDLIDEDLISNLPSDLMQLLGLPIDPMQVIGAVPRPPNQGMVM